ncbi:MAG: hypothetical protein KIT83_18355 [Bryobacterales bacterium]|nr:hypothetical protein [Bryobacterales bacterium]
MSAPTYRSARAARFRTGLGFLFLLAITLLAAALASAQKRDFLTTDEVEQVRQFQEPNERLMLYNRFAASRVGQIQDLLKKETAGRSLLIHDLLEDLVDIIDTIDVVADDALKNGFDISEGMQDVVKQHQLIAKTLQDVDAMDLKDRSRYQFQLQMALDTVEDAIELAQEDLAKRKGDVVAKEKKEQVEREAMRTPTEVEERKVQAAKQEEIDKKTGRTRKPPSLYKPGEKPGEPVAGAPKP